MMDDDDGVATMFNMNFPEKLEHAYSDTSF